MRNSECAIPLRAYMCTWYSGPSYRVPKRKVLSYYRQRKSLFLIMDWIMSLKKSHIEAQTLVSQNVLYLEIQPCKIVRYNEVKIRLLEGVANSICWYPYRRGEQEAQWCMEEASAHTSARAAEETVREDEKPQEKSYCWYLDPGPVISRNFGKITNFMFLN
jgi:hypothetical protein